MRTIRNNVFETNSSSCHSITIFKQNIWEQFKKGDILIRPGTFEYSEHLDTITNLSNSDFDENFITFEKFYSQTKTLLDNYKGQSDYYETPSSVKWQNLRIKVFKENYSEAFLKTVLSGSSSEEIIYSLESPLVVEWHWGGSSTMNHVLVSDLYNILSAIWDFNIPESIYHSDWKDAKITSGEPIKVELSYDGIISKIQCSDDSYIIDLDSKDHKITIRNLGLEEITVERDIEC